MKTKTKTIDIQGKSWFDKVNDNSYFSAQVTVNYGLKGVSSFKLPFQKGYGSQYEQAAFKELRERGFVPAPVEFYNCRKAGIIARSNIWRGCLKREVVAWGGLG